MLGVSWGAMVRPTCSCTGTCTCQARIRQASFQDSLDSLGVEWGLRVRPRARSPRPRVRPSLVDEEPLRFESSSSELVTEEEPLDPLRAFDDICISDEVADRMCFRERLEVAESPAGSALGLVTVSVRRSRTHGHLHVRVAGSARLPCADAPASASRRTRTLERCTLCSTSVLGCVDYRTQRTADERRYERCEEEGKGVEEKFLYMAQDEGNPQGHYFNIMARQRVRDFEDRRSQEVPFEDVANLVSEALTVVLLRFVGLTEFEGTLHLQAVLPNGALVPCIFEAGAPKVRVVYGHDVKCTAVTQYSADARGNPMALRSLVSCTTGQLLRHAPVVGTGPVTTSAGSLLLRAPHRHPPAPSADVLERPEPLAHGWEDDLQAQGMLRDKKEELMVRFRSLMVDRPEVRWLLTNFVQAALLSRPCDGLWLARQHFAMPSPQPQSRGPAQTLPETPRYGSHGGSPVKEGSNTDSGGRVEEGSPESMTPFLEDMILNPIFGSPSSPKTPPSPKSPDSPRTLREVVDFSMSAAVAAATDTRASQSPEPYSQWKGSRMRPFDSSGEESRYLPWRRYGSEGDDDTRSLPVVGAPDVQTQVRLQQAVDDYFRRPHEDPWGHAHIEPLPTEPVPWPSQPWHAAPPPQESYDPYAQQAWTGQPLTDQYQQYQQPYQQPYPQQEWPKGDLQQVSHEPPQQYAYQPQEFEPPTGQEQGSNEPQDPNVPERWPSPQQGIPESRTSEMVRIEEWEKEPKQFF